MQLNLYLYRKVIIITRPHRDGTFVLKEKKKKNGKRINDKMKLIYRPIWWHLKSTHVCRVHFFSD